MMPRHFQQYGHQSAKRCISNAEISEIYFPTYKPPISDECLCLCLEFAGLVGRGTGRYMYFWVY